MKNNRQQNYSTVRSIFIGIGILFSLQTPAQKMAAFAAADFSDSLLSKKQWLVVNTIEWKLKGKELKSMLIPSTENDTILYTIARTHGRQATIYFQGAEATILKQKFRKEENIVQKIITVNKDISFLFKIKNKSFLGNTFSISIRKILPPVKTRDTISIEPSKPKMISYDSVMVKMDTTVYLACAMNLNQPVNFIISLPPSLTTTIAVENNLQLHFSMSGQGAAEISNKNKLVMPCAEVQNQNKSQGHVTIICYRDGIRTDSILRQQANITYGCKTDLPAHPSERNVRISNQDKVIGKSVHIHLVEYKTIRKSVAANEK